MNIDEPHKKVSIFQQSKGQIIASIDKVEEFLTLEEFKDYCDCIYSCVAYQDLILKRIKEGNLPIKEDA